MNFSRNLSLRSIRGSALLAVLIFTSVLLILVGTLLKWSTTERRLNIRNGTYLEARNAAEALAEYGFSQIRKKYETRSSFLLNPNGSDALRLPPSDFWTGSNVETTTIELIGGTEVKVPETGQYYVDPNDPNNEFDPLKGKWIIRRDVAVIARATVRSTISGSSVTSYAMEKISVRGAPLFAHAIFYNMDLEISPGPVMNIYGPVHANGNIYCSSQSSGSSLNFYGPVTTSQNIYHSWKSTKTSAWGSGNETLGGTPVRFLNKTNALVELKTAAGVWKDSTMGIKGYSPPTADPSFRTYASQTWNGNLQTEAHGIQNYTPIAIGKYSAQANSTADNNNSARALIEGANWPATTDTNYTAKMEVEKQKYSNNAGIYIKIDPSSKQITEITSRKKGNIGNAAATKTLVSTPTADYKGIISYKPYTLGSVPAEGAAPSVPADPTPPTASGSGTTKTTSATATATGTNFVAGGLYDTRRGKGVDLVQIDMAKLKLAVTEMQKTAGSRDTTKAIENLDATDWTGIVYVEVLGGPTTRVVETTSGANDQGYTDFHDANALTTAVELINGNSTVPSYTGSEDAQEGLTIATNAPVYIKGHFNADGTAATPADPTQSPARKPETNEVPAAIVSDAITILSPGFNEAESYQQAVTNSVTVSQNWTKSGGAWVKNGASTRTPSSNTTTTIPNKPAPSGQVEVAAALLMGVSPTDKNANGAFSGGVHNFPRFLENWSGTNVWIRGSLVALFESRVGTEKWSTAYYGAPNRNWGFSDLFAAGRYPPGTPKVMSYRRVDYTDLSAARYNQIRTSFNWN